MGKEQKIGFEEIKYRLIKPPVLHLSNSMGTQVNLLSEAHYMKYRIGNQN